MADAGESPTDHRYQIPGEVADELPENPDIVTVTELSQQLADLVEHTEGVHHDYIVGDVTGVSESSSGHLYFDLEGEDCQLQCVVFSFRRRDLATDPEDEMRVLLEGDLEYYAPGGTPSIQVTDCHEIGEGAYAEVYEQTRATLEADGLFDEEQKQALPELPTRIGLVTSKHGDAVDDTIEAIHDRFPDVDIAVAHATVQGDDAIESLVSRIARLDEDPQVELIVVTRGGGADATLRTFNELAVCRTIARTDTPIAVGIGHENDDTLAGRVADERIMTPTDAGTLVPDREALEADIERLHDRLDTAFDTHAESELTALADQHSGAYEGTIGTRIQQLARDLDRAYEACEREAEYEDELETARAEARREAEQAFATRERRYQAAVVVLVALLVGVLVVTFVLSP